MNQKKWKLDKNLFREAARYKSAGSRYEAGLGTETPPETGGGALALAGRLYPLSQKVVISRIEDQGPHCRTLWLAPDAAAGQQELAPFLPGQHISITAVVEGSPVSRPYTLLSSPADARRGCYAVTVRAMGFLSDYLAEKAQVGEQLTVTGPEGGFFWAPLRDAPHLVALAGGSGVTGFISMARAIREGSLNADLTLLYTCPWQDGFLHEKELKTLQGAGVSVRWFCPDCPDGSLHPLTAADVDAAGAGRPYSLFGCGSPEAVQGFQQLVAGLKTVPASVHWGESGAASAPAAGEEFRLRVKARTVTYTVAAKPGETLLTALERAGIPAPSLCRGGRCGFCRSRWLSGEYRVLPGFESRLEGEEEAGWLHPCCSVPLSDMELEIFPL